MMMTKKFISLINSNCSSLHCSRVFNNYCVFCFPVYKHPYKFFPGAVPSYSSIKLLEGTSTDYSAPSKKALVARSTEREIRKLDPYKKVVQRTSSPGDYEVDPMWVTGFVDGEGSWTCSIIKNKNLKVGWEVKPSLKIKLHRKDKPVLEAIQNLLAGVGKIYNNGPEAVEFRVENIKDLEAVLYHFKKYKLLTQKHTDFLFLDEIFILRLKKEHLTPEGLRKILGRRASMNWGLSNKQKSAFPDIVPVERPKVDSPLTIDPNWLAGFTSAEGCFLINTFKSKAKQGETVRLIFQLTQHSRDEKLIRRIPAYLNCGNIYKNRDTYDYRVSKLEDITDKIIPFFKKYKIRGVKALDFQDWVRAAELMKQKKHLTADGIEKIKQIKAGMNRGRNI